MLMRRMRWTWQEYRSQPLWYIDILMLMERLDADKEREDAAKMEARSKAAGNKARRGR